MAPLPAFIVEATIRGADGPDLALGPLDLTRALLRLSMPHRDSPPILPSRPQGALLVSDGLPRPALDAAWAGRLVLADYAGRLAVFVDGLGGSGLLPLLRRAYDRLDRAASAQAEAIRLLADVEGAQAVGPDGYDFLYDPYAEAYPRTPGEAYRDWPVEAFLTRDPEPTAASPGERAAWEARREAFRRASAPPYLHATRPDPWSGLGAERLREEADNARAVDGAPVDANAIDLDAILDCELETHFEDAVEHLVDVEALRELVTAWLPHAGDGSAADLGLEAGLDAWNARQSIVSHYPDRSRIVLLADASKADAVAWCRTGLADAERALAAARRDWEPAPAAAA